MKKILSILGVLLCINYANAICLENNSEFKLSSRGFYNRIDTLIATFGSNKIKLYTFDETQTIPTLTIAGKDYQGYVDKEKNRLVWPVNLDAQDQDINENKDPERLTVTYNLSNVIAVKKADGSKTTLDDIYSSVSSINFPMTRLYFLAKYFPVNYNGYQPLDYNYSYVYDSSVMQPDSDPIPYLAGNYNMTLSLAATDRYVYGMIKDTYYNDGKAIPWKARILNADGDEVRTYDIEYDNRSTFSVDISEPITESGTYYIIYEVYGLARAWNAGSGFNSVWNHICPMKVGPYIVDSKVTSKRISPVLSSVAFNANVYTDDIPDTWDINVSNASGLQLLNKEGVTPSLRMVLGSNTYSVSPTISVKTNIVSISLSELKEEIKDKNLSAGKYTLYLDTPKNIISGYALNKNILDFGYYSNLSTTINLINPTPASTLDAYIEKSGSTVQLEKGESVKVKLGTADANDSKIFVKWTKAGAQTKAAATEAPAGFTQHSDAVIVSEAGTLEYYTQISNTISDVKSITFTVREPVAVAADVKQVAFGSDLYTDALPTEWCFSIENAATLAKTATNPTVTCTLPDKSTVSATCPLSVNGRMVTVNLAELNKKFTDPAKGNYTLAIATPETYLTATPISGDNIQWSAISASYSLSTPAPAGELNVFVKSKENAIELSQGETIEVKLATDNAGDHTVYYKWTPAEEASVVRPTNAPAGSAPAGFLEHTGTISVNGAGTLEYYTRHSNTISNVKSINFTVKADTPTDVSEIEAEAAEGDALYYNLDGVRVQDPSAPGIYIVKSANGKSRKVLVK